MAIITLSLTGNNPACRLAVQEMMDLMEKSKLIGYKLTIKKD